MVSPDVRLPRVVARAALIAALALIVVPELAGSRIPSAPPVIDPLAFSAVGLARSVTPMTMPQLDPNLASAGSLSADGTLREPQLAAPAAGAPRPKAGLPNARVIVRIIWHYDQNISWYGPGFYGQHTACGVLLTKDTVGVAHRTLPCGTKVTFRYGSHTVTAPVIDRGPYVSGRIWDLSHGLCALLNHCWTGGGVYYRID